MLPEQKTIVIVVTKEPADDLLSKVDEFSEKGFMGYPVEIRHVWKNTDLSAS